jgi:aryl-alcohol dehydrogenase-like predicted oxidoreductase
MKHKRLGNSSLEVAPLCIGGNVLGWTIDQAASFRVLDAALDGGLNFIDTADMYSRWVEGHSGGESETIIGKWLKQNGKRDQVVIATKLGFDMGNGKKGLSKARITQAVEESLSRLQTDVIDLYQAHTDDQEVPLEETLAAFGDLIKVGKIKAIGASNYTGPRLEVALQISATHGLPKYESLQPHYNLVYRKDYEETLEPVCRMHNVGVIPYYSLASGFLSGKYRSKADTEGKVRSGGVQQYLNDKGFAVLRALDEIAAAHSSRPAVVALAWLIARPSITSPIASATSVEQLQDLVAATSLPLTDGDIEQLNASSAY